MYVCITSPWFKEGGELVLVELLILELMTGPACMSTHTQPFLGHPGESCDYPRMSLVRVTD